MIIWIDADVVEVGARQWRHDHLPAYAAARPWMTARAALVLDTTALTGHEAADRIWHAVEERLVSS